MGFGVKFLIAIVKMDGNDNTLGIILKVVGIVLYNWLDGLWCDLLSLAGCQSLK